MLHAIFKERAERLIEKYKKIKPSGVKRWVQNRTVSERALLCLFLDCDSYHLAGALQGYVSSGGVVTEQWES
jgi:hypothetical protein